MRRRRRALVTLAALCATVALATACTSDDSSPLRDEFEAARARWDAAGSDDYFFFLQRRCECPPEWSARTMVIVRGGTVSSASIDGGFAPDGAALTIEELFDEIAAALDEPVDVAVTYDAELGHPLDVQLDLEAIAVDGGLSLTLSGFERLD